MVLPFCSVGYIMVVSHPNDDHQGWFQEPQILDNCGHENHHHSQCVSSHCRVYPLILANPNHMITSTCVAG